MQKIAAFLYISLFLYVNTSAQFKNEATERNELIQLARLLAETAMITTQATDWDEPLRQHLSFDDKNRKIVFRTSLFNENENKRKPEEMQWLVTNRIPLYEIDTIIENSEKNTIKIVMKNDRNSIAVYQVIPGNQYAPAGYTESVTIYSRTGEVRNLTKRLNQHIKNLQQYKFRELPATAKATVQQAVYDCLNVNEYKTASVQSMLDDSKLFIPKCQLCDGSKLAFTRYIEENKKSDVTDWIKFSVDPDLLSTGDKKMAALQKLVADAMEMYYNHFSAKQVSELKIKVEAERKRSMTLTNNEKKCASCDGACLMSEE